MQAAVLLTDPVDGNPDFLRGLLISHGCKVLVPSPSVRWETLAPGADALIVNLANVDAAAMASVARCRVIARLGVGTDNIDLEAATTRGIAVTNVPEYCTEEVSDHALALILASTRKLCSAHFDVQAGRWHQLGYRPIRRLNKQTLGLLGFGRLAKALAAKARALGIHIIAHDPFARMSDGAELVTFGELLERSDILSLHAPSTAETRHVIGQAALARMKPGAFLVNTARGDLIDENALIAALDNGRLAGVALDVFETEPLPAISALRERSNVLLTPHMAFYSEESLEDLQRIAAEDVLAVLDGRAPQHLIN